MSSTTKQETTFKEIENIPVPAASPSSPNDNNNPIASGTASDDSPTFNPPVPVQQAPKESPFVTQVKEIIVNISQDHYNKIIEGLKKDILRFEYLDKTGSIKVDNKTYVPMTIGQNKKVGKVLKKERLIREDISQFVTKQEGALTVEQILKKYPDVFDEDTDENDLKNNMSLNEIIGNYSVAQKANIYWGIEDIENYTLNDLVMIIALYESRNGFNPSS